MTAARSLSPGEIAALRDCATQMRALLERIDAVIAPANDASGELVDEYAERWFADRRARVEHVDHERQTYGQWIRPALGQVPITAVTRDQVERWIEGMDRRAEAGEIRWTTAWRVWTILRRLLRDSASAKTRALRVRADNPAIGVAGPYRGSMRASTFLYPSEFLRLMRCRRIPIARRRLYALAVYLYPRASELVALGCEDIDIRTGRVHIHAAIVGGRRKRTKTEADRQFVAERALLPLLRWLHRERGGKGPLVTVPRTNSLARTLRDDLEAAGCQRADLYADDQGRRPLTFHDLRATGITWQAMRGDSPTDIQERVGHRNLATTQGYMRRGRLLAVAAGERVFPPIPPELLGRGRKSTRR